MTELPSTRCFVYWVHLPEHTNIFTQGYVGITTKTVGERFQQHVWNSSSGSKNNTINNAINKYKDAIVCTTILEGSLEYCLLVENKLRQAPNTGWNINVGGDVPPMVGRKHSEDTKRKISVNRKLAQTPELIAKCMRNLVPGGPRSIKGAENIRKAKQDTGGWRLPWSNKQLWLYADVIYESMLEFPTKGSGAIQTASKVPKTVGNILNIFNKIKNTGWIPFQDPEWLLWKSDTLKGTHS